jgi:hypothetical protein
MPIIKNDKGYYLIIVNRGEMKYVDEYNNEFHIGCEMLVNSEYDFVIYTGSIKFYEDYVEEKKPENRVYTEYYDENTKSYIGELVYKKKRNLNISPENKIIVINRVVELLAQKKINVEIV